MLGHLRYVLRSRRNAAGLTLKQVEAFAGVDRSNLSNYETGKIGLPRDAERMVDGYARALDVLPAELWREALDMYERDPDGRRLERIATASERGRAAARRLRDP